MKKLSLFFAICSALTISAQNIPSYVPSNGLVAWYPFNGNANDESGNGNNGTVYGATLTTDRDGNANSAYNFNVSVSGGWGSAQQRIVVTNPSIPNNNQFTMSAWVNLDSKPSSFNNRPHSILGRWDGNGNSVFRFQLNDNTNYYSGQTFLQGDLPRIVSCPLVDFNNWHQHLISYDGNTLRRYLDGSMIDSFLINIQIPYSNSDLTFGEIHMANGHWLFFNGDMDDVGYWSRALSPSEIQSLYNGIQPMASINSRGCVECDSLNIGEEFVLNGDSMIVVDRPMLDSMISGGHDVTKACVSHVTDMRNLLRSQSWFNQDIGNWDVSNVTNMNRMFKKASSFNQDISNWDVGDVNRMTEMFNNATAFNQDLSDWCVRAFQYNAPPNFALNGALISSHYPRWGNCPQDFDNITTLATGAFLDSNGCIDCSALNIGEYFEIGGDTLLVVDRGMLDSLILLHDDLSKVCVSNITDMKDALRGLRWFNTDIAYWDVSNVTDMSNMFFKAKIFNQDIGNWDVSSVSRMSRMFQVAKAFNQDIGGWDVSNVQRFRAMFRNADAFNQDIGGWDVSSVLNDAQMSDMFRSADNFSQDLSMWCVSNVVSKPSGFDANSPLTASQLPQWGTCPVPPFVNANGCVDCLSLNIGDKFVLNGDSMIVVDRTMLDSMVASGYDVTKVCVSHITSMYRVFYGRYNFNQNISNWDVSNVVTMWGMFDDAIVFNQDISNWDVSKVNDMGHMFRRAAAFNEDIGNWDVSNVTSMMWMFWNASIFNHDISNWNVSNVLNMDRMFRGCTNFNQNLSSWCVSQFSSKPSGFDKSSALTTANLPQWGTCPTSGNRISSDDPIASNEANVDNASNKEELQEIILFPNPTTGMVKISPLVEGTYRFYNEVGRTIDAGQIKETFDFSNQSNGIYMLILQTDNGMIYLKVVKQ